MTIVYKHTNKINGKVYIGISQHTWQQRAGVGGQNYFRNLVFARDIAKYGWNNFTHEVLASGLKNREALDLEFDYIRKYRSYLPEYGYNIDIRNANAKMVRCKETGDVFFSCVDAEKWGGLSGNSFGAMVSKNCRNLSKSCGKHPETGIPLHWEYYHEYTNIDLQKELQKKGLALIAD